MEQQKDKQNNLDWLIDLADQETDGDDLRESLLKRTSSAEELERATKEINISRRVSKLMIKLKTAEIEVPADFEARLMTKVRNDETMLSLLEIYSTGFCSVLIELFNLISGLLPDPIAPKLITVER
jgi:hypothetical protein